MPELTVECVRKFVEELEAISIKPYKGYYGLDENGLFEIKDEEEFRRLREVELALINKKRI